MKTLVFEIKRACRQLREKMFFAYFTSNFLNLIIADCVLRFSNDIGFYLRDTAKQSRTYAKSFVLQSTFFNYNETRYIFQSKNIAFIKHKSTIKIQY